MKGSILDVVKALHKLGTNAARFCEHLTDNLKILGYVSARADLNLFCKGMENHYEYVASCVDYILNWSRDLMRIMAKLKAVYTMKGIGIPK